MEEADRAGTKRREQREAEDKKKARRGPRRGAEQPDDETRTTEYHRASYSKGGGRGAPKRPRSPCWRMCSVPTGADRKETTRRQRERSCQCRPLPVAAEGACLENGEVRPLP